MADLSLGAHRALRNRVPLTDRAAVESLIEQLIAALDREDAAFDADEPNFIWIQDGLPGDPADAESSQDDEAGAWAEFHSLSATMQRSGRFYSPQETLFSSAHEDDEDDDPAEPSDHDEDDDPAEASDFDEADDEGFPSWGVDQRHITSPLAAAIGFALANDR